MADRDKFKVWDKEKKEWVKYPTDICINLDGDVVELTEMFVEISVSDDFKLVRCTGIELENSDLLYQGDIVYIAGTGNCKVVWSESDASWGFEDKDDFYDYQSCIEDLEYKIGNIYSNPELDPTKEKV